MFEDDTNKVPPSTSSKGLLLLRELSMSLIFIINNNGSNTDLWGTPCVHGLQTDEVSPFCTYISLLLR